MMKAEQNMGRTVHCLHITAGYMDAAEPIIQPPAAVILAVTGKHGIISLLKVNFDAGIQRKEAFFTPKTAIFCTLAYFLHSKFYYVQPVFITY
jgi:hypothetical protein